MIARPITSARLLTHHSPIRCSHSPSTTIITNTRSRSPSHASHRARTPIARNLTIGRRSHDHHQTEIQKKNLQIYTIPYTITNISGRSIDLWYIYYILPIHMIMIIDQQTRSLIQGRVPTKI